MNRAAFRFFPVIVCLVAVACGGSKSPASPGDQTPTTLSLAGTWTGTMTRPLGDLRVKSWTATQTGASVTGPMVLDLDGSAAEVLVTGTFNGTVSGTQLTSGTFTLPTGQIPDVAACGFSGSGTLTASASTISGPLAMVFPAACVGDRLVHTTATGTFNLTLTK